MEIDENILEHYNKGNEKDRLNNLNPLEKIRTWDILNRYLPKNTKIIADIGGGPGVYAFMLSEQGYEVHLLDAVPLHIQQANEIDKTAKHKLATIQVGDARKLPYKDNFADAILSFGPLYHLTNKSDRKQALQEAYRILKQGGLIFSVGISKYASLLDGFKQKFILDDDYRRIVLGDLNTGDQRIAN